jgi:hypothetical protein
VNCKVACKTPKITVDSLLELRSLRQIISVQRIRNAARQAHILTRTQQDADFLSRLQTWRGILSPKLCSPKQVDRHNLASPTASSMALSLDMASSVALAIRVLTLASDNGAAPPQLARALDGD